MNFSSWLCLVCVLEQAVALFKSYFGGAFDEDAIRNNFVLIYELLDGTFLTINFVLFCMPLDTDKAIVQ